MGEENDEDPDKNFEPAKDGTGGTPLKVLRDPAAAERSRSTRRQSELSGKGVLQPSAAQNGTTIDPPIGVAVSSAGRSEYGPIGLAQNHAGSSSSASLAAASAPLDGAPASDYMRMPGAPAHGEYGDAPPEAVPFNAAANSEDGSVPPANSVSGVVDVAVFHQPEDGSETSSSESSQEESDAGDRLSTCAKVVRGLGIAFLVGVVLAVITLASVFGTRAAQAAADANATGPKKPVVKAQKGTFKKPGTMDSTPVLADAEAVANTQILPATLEITPMMGTGAGTYVTALTVPGEGKWTVDTAKGAVVFAPEAGLKKNPTPILFRVSDNQQPAQVSDPGSLTLTYDAFPVVLSVPLAANIVVPDQVAGSTVKIDVAAQAKPSDGATINKASIRLTAGGQGGRVVMVVDEGNWLAGDDGIVTFVPDKALAANPHPVTYTIADTSGLASVMATLEVRYKTLKDYVIPPGVLPIIKGDFDIPPQVAGKGIQVAPIRIDLTPHIKQGDNPIDPLSVLLISTSTPAGTGGPVFAVPGDPVTVGTVTMGFHKITVPDQGVWTVEPDPANAKKMQIVFTPALNAVEYRTLVTWTVADTKGLYANPTTISLFPELDKVIDMARALAVKSDDDFWNDLTAQVAPLTDIDDLAAVIVVLENLTKVQLAGMAPGLMQAFSFTGLQLNKLRDEMIMAANMPAQLMIIGAREVTDAKTGFGATPLATRFLRLNMMRQIYARYLGSLVQTMGGSTN